MSNEIKLVDLMAAASTIAAGMLSYPEESIDDADDYAERIAIAANRVALAVLRKSVSVINTLEAGGEPHFPSGLQY